MIHIIEDYYYRYDEMQYILYHKYDKPKDKAFGEIKGYFVTLENLLAHLVDLLVKEQADAGNVTDIAGWIDELREAHARVKAVIEK